MGLFGKRKTEEVASTDVEQKEAVQEKKETGVCHRCKFYARPKCTKHDRFTARKNSCDDWKRK